MDTSDNNELEKAIEQVIVKIKDDRSRPCYQNVLNSIRRRGFEIDMDGVKIALDDLVDRAVITRKVNKDKVSFSVINDPVGIENGGDNSDGEEGENGHFENSDKNDVTVGSLESFIDDKLHDILVNKIKLVLTMGMNPWHVLKVIMTF